VRRAAEDVERVDLPAGVRRRGLVVARQESGVELIVGGRRDTSFGPLVLVGLGGVLAEVLDDVVVRLAPLELDEALEMLDDLHGRRILDGIRGEPPVDREAIADIVVAVGRLLVDDASIVEVDLNPVIGKPSGAVAVDALVVEALP
jgi:acyl-CoA synthetase (NDP forming)